MHTDPKAALAQLEARCAAAGTPVTSQRRAVLLELLGRDDHPTVDQLYQAVAERMPDVSRATVYRTVEKLEELALVTRVPHPGSSVRLDGNTEPHHHFLCTRCEAIEDLAPETVPGHADLAFVAGDERAPERIAVQVFGICQRCSAA